MIIRYLDHLHYFFGLINVIQAEEYPRPDFTEMIKTTVRMLEEYNIRFDNSCRIFVDTANPSFITTLKQAVNEDLDYVKQIAILRTQLSVNIRFAVPSTEHVCHSCTILEGTRTCRHTAKN